MLSGAKFAASWTRLGQRFSGSSIRGYQSGAAGIYGHNPEALARLRRVLLRRLFVQHLPNNSVWPGGLSNSLMQIQMLVIVIT